MFQFASRTPVKLWLVLFSLGSLSWITPLASQSRQADVQRDIDILETVLCQVLGQGESSRFWGCSCRGMYLEGFGIIFNVPYEHSFGRARAPKVRALKGAGNRNLAETYYAAAGPEPADSSRAEERAQTIEKLKKDLNHFFTSYAVAVRGLAPGEVMAVMVDWTDASPAFWDTPSPSIPAHFYASVRQEQLAQLRQAQNAAGAIHYSEKTADDELNRELDIFENILSKTLAGSDQAPMPGKSIRSMYLPGYGVVVMTSLHEFSALAVAGLERSTGVLDMAAAAKTRNESRSKRLPAIKDDVLDVLARFGGSLRSLKPAEALFIQAEMSRGFGEESGKGFTCKARMADIAQVYSGSLSADAFKAKVQIRDF